MNMAARASRVTVAQSELWTEARFRVKAGLCWFSKNQSRDGAAADPRRHAEFTNGICNEGRHQTDEFKLRRPCISGRRITLQEAILDGWELTCTGIRLPPDIEAAAKCPACGDDMVFCSAEAMSMTPAGRL
jgi:hypothetical protein